MITQVFKRIFLSANIFSATILIIGILAGYISPAELPLLILFGLAFPYFLIINFGFVIFWGILKHRYFLISTLVILLSLPITRDTFQFIPKHSKNSESKTVKVMSYNVRVFDLYNWSKNKITRNKIFQLIRDENPDIACFQEYFNNTNDYFPVHDSLITNQRFRHAHVYFNVKQTNGHNFGIATYSSYPIVNKKEILFEGTHNLAIISDIKINNDTLRILNCHLESVRFLAKDYQFMDSLPLLSDQQKKNGFLGVTKRLMNASVKRATQADEIYDEIKQSPYPIILCGDFNDTPSSYTYQKISSMLKDSHAYHKMGIGGTYNQFLNPLRIDYILYSDNIMCHKFKTIKVKYSDHYPVVGEYSIH